MTMANRGAELAAQQSDSTPTSEQVVRCGVIGFGKMGRIRAETIIQSGLGCVDLIFDPHVGQDSQFNAVADPQHILDAPDLDAVFVCTPNFRNKELTIAAMKAGKHVFCEKPPAFTAADVEEIMAVEQASGCKLMYGFNHRHHESIKTAKAAVDSGEFGRLLWMRGRYGKSVDDSFFASWRADKHLAGGGILLDQGIHMLDLLLHFAGDFDDVQAMVSTLFWNLDGIEDNVFANFRNSDTGVVASLHSTMTQWRHIFSLEIFLSGGHIVLNGLKTSSNSYGEEVLTLERNAIAGPAVKWQDTQRITYDVDTSWASEAEHFLTCIASNRPIEDGCSQDALRVMRLIGKVYDQSH